MRAVGIALICVALVATAVLVWAVLVAYLSGIGERHQDD